MRNYLPNYAVIGVLLCMLASQQAAIAQGLREPTLDDQYRDTDSRAADFELPRLNGPPSTSTRDMGTPPEKLPAAFLGVTFAPNERAAIVHTVVAGSPAEEAGLQPNDLIEALQGRRVRTNQDVLDIVSRMLPGDVLDIEFSRRMNIRTQAPLASAPAPGPHSVGYPADLPPSTFAAPEDPMMQSNRDLGSQYRYDNSASQRRNDGQRGNQPDDNRRLLNRLLRRR